MFGIQPRVNPRTPLIEPGQLIVYSVAVFTPEYKKTFLHDVTKQADSEGKKDVHDVLNSLCIIMSFTYLNIKIIL